jgi:hypothetical protein
VELEQTKTCFDVGALVVCVCPELCSKVIMQGWCHFPGSSLVCRISPCWGWVDRVEPVVSAVWTCTDLHSSSSL